MSKKISKKTVSLKSTVDGDIRTIMSRLCRILLAWDDKRMALVLARVSLEHCTEEILESIKARLDTEKSELDKCQAEIDADQAAKERRNDDA